MSFEGDPARSARKRWFVNRFVLVPCALVLIAVLWNVWVFTHNHGVVAGRVVDAAGAPVKAPR